MPHFYGFTNTGQSIIATTQAACAANATFTMDNLELGPWNYWTVKSTDCITFTMRNSYIHDRATRYDYREHAAYNAESLQ